MSHQWLETRVDVLRLCITTLDRMSRLVTAEQLTPKYVPYFDLLCREVLKNVSKSWEQCLIEPRRQAFQYSAAVDHHGGDALARETVTKDFNCTRQGNQSQDSTSPLNGQHSVYETPMSMATTDVLAAGKVGGGGAGNDPIMALPTEHSKPKEASPSERHGSWNGSDTVDVNHQVLEGLPFASQPLRWTEGCVDLEPVVSLSVCQNPNTHPQPCYCGLNDINDSNQDMSDWWPTADEFGGGTYNFPSMSGGNEQGLSMFFNEWESSGMWQSILRQSTDRWA